MKNNNLLQKTWQKLVNFEKKNNFFKTGQNVLVGLSGGADSVALLHFTKQLANKKRFSVIACHINHGLRQAAAKDAAFAKKTAKELDVKFVSRKANVKALAKKENLSTEHAARKARYKILEQEAKKHNCPVIALAHHGDDNAETILLNLLRGTKAKGILGIPLSRKIGSCTVVRPFLCVTRKEVINYLDKHGLSFVEDETNSQDIYTRNWVRQKLLPLLESKQPKIREHLLSIASDAAKYIK